jgi:hypothetical protein
MERLTWVSGSFTARVLEARLHSEGIDCDLRGAVDSPYGLTVGDMARVDVFVPADQLEDAQLVMLADEVDAALAAPREWGGEDAAPAGPWSRWLIVAAIGVAALAPIVWYVLQA